MKHSISTANKRFCEQVESCVLPAADFDHRAHLKLAYIYLTQYDVESAYLRTKEAILNILDHNNIDPTKFHVTITRAWVLAVRHFMALTPACTDAETFIERQPVMLDSKIMLTHYSKEHLFSDVARLEFVQPDRDPIPRYAD